MKFMRTLTQLTGMVVLGLALGGPAAIVAQQPAAPGPDSPRATDARPTETYRDVGDRRGGSAGWIGLLGLAGLLGLRGSGRRSEDVNVRRAA
jgi:hypothetical protein